MGERDDLTLAWRADCFGAKDRALFVGGIYAGVVNRIVPEGWRGWPLYLDDTSDKPEHVAKNIASSKTYYERMEATPWRAWLSIDEDGCELGRYATEAEAKMALHDKVVSLLSANPPHREER